MKTKPWPVGAVILLLFVTQTSCKTELIGGVEASGPAGARGVGQRAFAWLFHDRPPTPTITSDDLTIDEAALYVLIGDGERTCQDPYLLADGTICTANGCIGPEGWQLAFVIPTAAQTGQMLSAADPALRMELAWAKPPVNDPTEQGLAAHPYTAGTVEVLSVSAAEVVVRFSGLVAGSGVETLGAEAELEGQEVHALRNCQASVDAPP